jgi:glycosyltransferase involved in cell wall biosynthesis
MITVAIIPAYNEGKAIGAVVKQTLRHVDRVFVENDGSTDNTQDEATKAGAICVNVGNGEHGAGRAIAIGVNTALNYGADTIVLLDGDGQHNPDDIPTMLSLLKDYDVVITSRFMDKLVLTQMPSYRKFGIWIINLAYNFCSNFKVRDSQCGLRAFRANVLNDIKPEETGFGFCTEMLIKARKKKYRIVEIPTIVHYYKEFKQNSSMNPIKHGLDALLCTIKWRIKCEVFNQ